MVECPICGLGERCRNHWVAVQTPQGEVEFQVGAMTASEDNLVMLRNKLSNPPLRVLFEKIALKPMWVEEQGRLLAYLHWPLELRGAVHKSLFPNGAPGADNRPLPPTPMHAHRLLDLRLESVALDLVNCLPDEVLYKAHFTLQIEALGEVGFDYVQIIWADEVDWSRALATPEKLHQATAIIQLLMTGLVDSLREVFAGQPVQVLAEEQPQALTAGSMVDEIATIPAAATPQAAERHLGEEIESMINQRRLQPMLRDSLLALALSSATVVH
jgi:hypothetical protein